MSGLGTGDGVRRPLLWAPPLLASHLEITGWREQPFWAKVVSCDVQGCLVPRRGQEATRVGKGLGWAWSRPQRHPSREAWVRSGTAPLPKGRGQQEGPLIAFGDGGRGWGLGTPPGSPTLKQVKPNSLWSRKPTEAGVRGGGCWPTQSGIQEGLTTTTTATTTRKPHSR